MFAVITVLVCHYCWARKEAEALFSFQKTKKGKTLMLKIISARQETITTIILSPRVRVLSPAFGFSWSQPRPWETAGSITSLNRLV